ncbi:MAG: hypothetical protein ACI8RD_010401, partial [Bacillariaceae sp.]
MNGASETADGTDLSTKNLNNAATSPSAKRLISVVVPEI